MFISSSGERTYAPGTEAIDEANRALSSFINYDSSAADGRRDLTSEHLKCIRYLLRHARFDEVDKSLRTELRELQLNAQAASTVVTDEHIRILLAIKVFKQGDLLAASDFSLIKDSPLLLKFLREKFVALAQAKEGDSNQKYIFQYLPSAFRVSAFVDMAIENPSFLIHLFSDPNRDEYNLDFIKFKRDFVAAFIDKVFSSSISLDEKIKKFQFLHAAFGKCAQDEKLGHQTTFVQKVTVAIEVAVAKRIISESFRRQPATLAASSVSAAASSVPAAAPAAWYKRPEFWITSAVVTLAIVGALAAIVLTHGAAVPVIAGLLIAAKAGAAGSIAGLAGIAGGALVGGAAVGRGVVGLVDHQKATTSTSFFSRIFGGKGAAVPTPVAAA